MGFTIMGATARQWDVVWTYELGDEPGAALEGQLVHLGGVLVLLAGLF